jgi:hypothetical protein
MLHKQLDLSSRPGVYRAYFGALIAFAVTYTILLSASVGELMNTTFVNFQSNDAIDGIASNGALSGVPSYNAQALRDGAGSFIHLTSPVTGWLGLVLLWCLVIAAVLAVECRSYAMLFTPCIALVVLTTVFGAVALSSNALILTALFTSALGSAAILCLQNWRLFAGVVKRTPNKIPVDAAESSSTRPSDLA